MEKKSVKKDNEKGKESSAANKNSQTKPEATYKKRLFGTDGIRGTAGKFPVTPEIIVKVGQALGHLISKQKNNSDHIKVVIGKDTRLSGYMVEQALASGLNSVGVHVQLVGPLPTPGVGFLANNMRATAGIVISASHNPYKDNGIKIFGADGFKISDKMEVEIERLVLDKNLNELLVTEERIGRTKRIDDATGRYIVYAKNTFPLDLTLEGVRVVLDCANGAAYKVAPMIIEELGAEVVTLSNSPNGFNVNKDAGALHPETLSDAVQKYRADVGIALDGDADRVIMTDENGDILDGDMILAICAIHLKEQNLLRSNKVIATTMSNMALEETLETYGIEVERVDVGDKNVVKALREKNLSLGGEQSGHIIFLDYSTTGDGIVAALKVLEVTQRKQVLLSTLRKLLKPYPQILRNIKVSTRTPIHELPGYSELIEYQKSKLDNKGRVMIRYSGTEPLLRILVEGKDEKVIEDVADHVEKFLKTHLV